MSRLFVPVVVLFLIPSAGPSAEPEKKLAPKEQSAYAGRTGVTKRELIKEYGGNAESERSVALGLAWLAKQQKEDGSWVFDVGARDQRVAATGLALLPFLGAGETHNDAEGKYKDTVKKGLDWLMKNCPSKKPNDGFGPSEDVYSQAIGALALCEAYAMTKDPALKPAAQAAIDSIQKAQGKNGSWGYRSGADGDMSITGWQIQALRVARMSKDLVVDDKVIKKASGFLDLAAGGSRKSMYGYNDNAGSAPGTALTAVGLLCRYYIDGWGRSHPGMIDGVAGLVRNPPPGRGEIKNMYYYYYATQVVRLSWGDYWTTWNEGAKANDGKRQGGMRDWLIGAQVRKDGDAAGSWDPEKGWIGTRCGRLGTTAICLLNLEVYYRDVPTEKKDDKK
jgi:hypothetical protein